MQFLPFFLKKVAEADQPGLDDAEAEGLTTWVSETFKDRFSKVSTSDRVTSAPAIALQGEGDISPEIKAYLRAGMLDVPAKLADNSQALLEKLLNK